MPRFILDSAARRKLAGQLLVNAATPASPLQWHALLNKLQFDRLARHSGDGSLFDVLTNKARLFAWQPTMEALAASRMPGGLTYLCWGAPRSERRKPRYQLLYQILHGANNILVNDPYTRDEVLEWTGRDAEIWPFFVDADYFQMSPLSKRQDFLFCNGSNDRDPELLCSLAERGYRIVWLVNDLELRQRFEAVENITCISNIPFSQLRELYQTCAAYIMPQSQDFHCAGQTTGMEAIYCGAPVFISKGRTATIFKNLPSVTIIEGDADVWAEALNGFRGTRDMDAALEEARFILQRNCSTERVAEKLSRVFDWPTSHFQKKLID